MLDRLVDLLNGNNCYNCEKYEYGNCTEPFGDCNRILQLYPDDIRSLAEYLLNNGVIVPPCKIGDTIYEAVFYNKGEFSHWNDSIVVGFHLGDFPRLRGTKRNQYIIVWHRVPNCITHVNLDKFGKTVFLKHQIEEAEKLLREKRY